MHTTQVVRLPAPLLPLLPLQPPLAAVSADLPRGPVLLVIAWLLLALSLIRSLQLGVALRLRRLSRIPWRVLAGGLRPALGMPGGLRPALGARVLLMAPLVRLADVEAAACDAAASAEGDSDPEYVAVTVS